MRQEKQLLLDEVKGMIERHSAFVVMSYSKLNANVAGDFRRQIAAMGGDVEMVNKRILIKAAAAAGVELDLAALPGHIGVVFGGEDPLQTTKAVFKLRKESNDTVEVVAGRFEGKLFDGKQVEVLSELPGKDEMRAQLLSVLVAPMQQTAGVMHSVLCSVIYCLENKSKVESH